MNSSGSCGRFASKVSAQSKNTFPCILSVGLLLVLASCKPKSTGGSNQAASGERVPPHGALEWSLSTSVGDYEKHGRKNVKWDRFAKEALTEYARITAGVKGDEQNRYEMVGHYAQRAVEAGCDDPLIKYVYCRYALSMKGEGSTELANAYRAAAEGLWSSDYSPIRKFYATLRTAEVMYGWGRDTNTWPQVFHFRKTAAGFLRSALNDKSMPIAEVYDASHALLRTVDRHDLGLEITYEQMNKPLFENWPNAAVSYLLKAEFYISYAWCARGGGYANTVTEDRWQKFRERLDEAEKALGKAWTLDPKDSRIPTLMISLEHGQGKGKERMELWFTRAMELNTNNYDACAGKLLYLYPQWYGSRDDMLEFGRQCVQSDKWGGNVPLILADAHEQLARYIRDPPAKSAYWKQPDVWPDIKASFEKFFRLNPAEIGWRHNYARAAYTCEQWKDLNEQLKLLGPVNYAFFGGSDEFDKMVRLAKEHAEQSPEK